MQSTIDVAKLASCLREKLVTQGLSVRKAASTAGVSYTALQRALQGNHLPDPANLVLLTKWLDISVEQLTNGRSDADHTIELRSDREGDHGTRTPEGVAHLLRTDRALKPEDVEELMVVFRSLYDCLRARNEGHAATELAMSRPNTK